MSLTNEFNAMSYTQDIRDKINSIPRAYQNIYQHYIHDRPEVLDRAGFSDHGQVVVDDPVDVGPSRAGPQLADDDHVPLANLGRSILAKHNFDIYENNKKQSYTPG